MDDHRRDRVLELAARAGMLLEHTSATLILLPGEPPDQIGSNINSASGELERAIELLASAKAMLE